MLFFQSRNQVVISRSAKFLEHGNWSKFCDSEIYLPESEQLLSQSSKQALLGQHDKAAVPEQECKEEEGESTSDLQDGQAVEFKQEAAKPREPELCRSQCPNKGKPPDQFTVGAAIACNVPSEPQSYREVLQLPQPEKSKWLQAMEAEMAAMEQLEVFEWCELPGGQGQ